MGATCGTWVAENGAALEAWRGLERAFRSRRAHPFLMAPGVSQPTQITLREMSLNTMSIQSVADDMVYSSRLP
jgi:hypothetical protein